MCSTLLCIALFAIPGALGKPTVKSNNLLEFKDVDIASGKPLAELNKLALKGAAKQYSTRCNERNIKVRKEWRTLSKPQQRDYIAAVQCLLSKPSILEPGHVPAAQNLFDDFVYIHLNQTEFVHGTGNFLPWHRFSIHTYENRLTGCGYQGALPYWEWGFDVDSPKDSPLFDGSDTSIGSDGAPVPHGDLMVQNPGEPIVWRYLPGTGGGCIHSGPFVNMTVDRVYWIWQMLDFENRNKVAMTITARNSPPSRNATLNDPMWLDPLASKVKIRDMMNTVDGDHLCYVYELHGCDYVHRLIQPGYLE